MVALVPRWEVIPPVSSHLTVLVGQELLEVLEVEPQLKGHSNNSKELNLRYTWEI